MADWHDLGIKERLTVEYCVDIVRGACAGLPPGVLRSIRHPASNLPAGLLLEFESGSRWAVQARSGQSLQLEWAQNKPFVEALRWLYHGAEQGHIDLAPDSLDRLILAIDRPMDPHLSAFAQWLHKARGFVHWQAFVEASDETQPDETNSEKSWCEKLPVCLGAQGNDSLLQFIGKLYVEERQSPDVWWNRLRHRLCAIGVPGTSAAEEILDVLTLQVTTVAESGGVLDRKMIQAAGQGIPGFPRTGTGAFRVLHQPSEDSLRAALELETVEGIPTVERPELGPALASDEGWVIVGRPGSGKTTALAALVLSQPGRPAIVIKRHFASENLGQLAAAIRRMPGRFDLVWDDVQDDPAPFIDHLRQAADRDEPARILAAFTETEPERVWRHLVPADCHKLKVQLPPLLLRPFVQRQAEEMAAAITTALGLQLNAECLRAYAEHIAATDAGPLFAISIGRILKDQAQSGRPITIEDIRCLPETLIDTWRTLYGRLRCQDPNRLRQHVLQVLRFLHEIGCPFTGRLVELLCIHALGHEESDLSEACQDLKNRGWLECRDNEIYVHPLKLRALPANLQLFRRFEQFAERDFGDYELELGRLQQGLARYYAGEIRKAGHEAYK